jgi:hypothetical protein
MSWDAICNKVGGAKDIWKTNLDIRKSLRIHSNIIIQLYSILSEGMLGIFFDEFIKVNTFSLVR